MDRKTAVKGGKTTDSFVNSAEYMGAAAEKRPGSEEKSAESFGAFALLSGSVFGQVSEAGGG
jgi:hypothetical protein